MQKFKSVGLVGLGLILGVMGFLVISNNKSNETYDDTPVLENKELLSMMLETEAGSGKYQETTASSWPTDGYTFNETLSKCENGGTLSWDSTNKKVVMEGNSSDKCYVYFDAVSVLKSFKIVNNIYYFENGMTFENWIKSDYNTDGCEYKGGKGVFITQCVIGQDMSLADFECNPIEDPNTLIVENYTYRIVNAQVQADKYVCYD